MNQTLVRTIVAVAAIVVGASAFARKHDHEHERRHERKHESSSERATERTGSAMEAIANPATPGEPAHGWRYFSDAASARAVVISPQGEYFLSRGEGLRPVAQRLAARH